MAITDLLVLPADVLLTPLAELPDTLRRRLPVLQGGFALGRARARASSRVVSRDAAELLRRFRTPTRIADAIIAHSGKCDPRRALADSFPLLRDCYDARFLVPASSPDASRIMPSLDKGERVAGFAVLRHITVLEDSELYQARDSRGRVGAIKIARIGSERRLRRALREEQYVLELLGGRGAPRLRSAGIVEGRPFMVMSWCSGVSPLVRARELRSAGNAGRAPLLHLLVSIARAYARLHARGVLHGDIHAGNLLVSAQGRITILDFGCSRAPGRRPVDRGVVLPYSDPLFAEAMLAGSSPPPLSAVGEQCALAALLYHMAAGTPHVGGTQDREVMLHALARAEPLPFAANGAAPWPGLEAVLGRALAQQAQHRFPSVRHFADALAGCTVPRAGTPVHIQSRSRADRWLRNLARRSPPEWARMIAAPRCSMMHGTAGTAFGLYRLALLRNDAELLWAAIGWYETAKQASRVSGAFLNPRQGLGASVTGSISPYFTGSGLVLVDAHLAQAAGQLTRMAAAIERFCALDVAAERRIELGLGIAGVLLGAVMLLEAAPPELAASRGLLRVMGEELMRRLGTALAEFGAFPAGGPLDNAGIAHGWGGVLYAMLRWCRIARQTPTQAIARSLAMLGRLAEPRGRGVQFPHVPGTGGHHDIPGWCNGPAGLVHLWSIAHQLTPNDRYAAMAERCGWSAWEAPDRYPDLCCGLTGRSYALLALHRMTGDTVWLKRARTLRDRVSRNPSRTAASRLSLYKGALGPALLEQDLETPDLACHPFFESEGWPLGVSPSHG
jgi:serine/threonine-protein kinase